MSNYLPPTSITPIYNPNNFPSSDPNSDLTLSQADARYVSLSTSQTVNGLKTFPSAVGINTISNTGTLTLPTTTGTLALTSQIPTSADYVDRTTNQSIAGIKTFSNQISMADGSVSNPSVRFSSETNSGLYRSGANSIDFAVGGNNRLNISSSAVAVNGASTTLNIANTESGTGLTTGAIRCQGGASFGGTLYIASPIPVGLFIASYVNPLVGTGFQSANTSFNTTLELPVYNGTDTLVSQLHTQTLSNKTLSCVAGAVGAPSLYFSTDTTSGFYRPSANQIAVSTSGTNRMTVSSTGVQVSGLQVGTNGSTIGCVVRGSTSITPPASNGTFVTVAHNMGATPVWATGMVSKGGLGGTDAFSVNINAWTTTTAQFYIWRVDVNSGWGNTYTLFWSVMT